MRSLRRSFCAFCALVTCVLGLGVGLVGCSGNASATATRALTSMDTGMTITVNAATQNAAEDAAQACEQRIVQLDTLLAPTGTNSEIAQVNSAHGKSVSVSASLCALVGAALDAARDTDGAFDPTVYPLTDAWGFTNGEHRVPAPDEIQTLLTRVGYPAIQVDASVGSITLANDAQIDVGGVAKGFAADQLSDLLRERGITSALLDLGGNVTAFGSKPDGSAWKVGIADPRAPERVAGKLETHDVTVSTSGAYQRFFDGEDGTRYHHLLDPATGYPAHSDLASASVIGPNGARCDALSTACFVMGSQGALSLWRASSGERAFSLVLITNDGRMLVTEDIAASLSAAEGYADHLSVEDRS